MRRHANTKIRDIKHFREFTKFLGKLHIKGCYYRDTVVEWDMDIEASSIATTTFETTREYYGWGLKDTKDYVERVFTYIDEAIQGVYIPNRPLMSGHAHNDQIAEIKGTRIFMAFLNKLGLRNADPGLKVCANYIRQARVTWHQPN